MQEVDTALTKLASEMAERLAALENENSALQQRNRLRVGDVRDDAAGNAGEAVIVFGEERVGRLAAMPGYHLP